MITVPHSNNYDPGTWKALTTDKGKLVTFTCPNGHTLNLEEYEILEDGSVHPSVLCPIDECDFNEFIRLRGWSSVPQPLPVKRI